ncbi:HlyD family secretion protein [Spirosoma oryzae]|uniref:HlyD family secretion protein n=1 Tax=Spirosoma oryzae TaxID=1469603 RepID=A0A2T0SRF0_9BACT|nr:HlyD family efflux transporter periplasmic adaptor subunit [Spirosoma oryzae]PRY35978.1 HlyD family secretion protein [Spirosoma oryzae]
MDPLITPVDLRSEEAQEMLSRPPNWIMHWGTSVIFLILLSLIVLAWVIQYPDIVRAEFLLTPVNTPKAVLATHDGKLKRLLVKDGAWVKSETALAYLESLAKPSEIHRLSLALTAARAYMEKGEFANVSRMHLTHFQQLGELQANFQTFYTDYVAFCASLEPGFYGQKQNLLKQELTDLQQATQALEQQQTIQQKDAVLAEEEFAIQKQLLAQRVISPLDLKREESKLLARQLPFQQTKSALVANQINQHSKQVELLELQRTQSDERKTFMQSLQILRAAVLNWQHQYILFAPVDGRLFNSSLVQENQPITSGQELFLVTPTAKGYFGEIRIAQQNYGQVRIGQRVLIKLAAYPFERYGVVRGKIVSISEIPSKDGSILARVLLPAGLQTSADQRLPYKVGLTGSAEVITDSHRLLEKIVYQFKELISNSSREYN